MGKMDRIFFHNGGEDMEAERVADERCRRDD